MKLLSVNVSELKEININGKNHSTGIFKRPVTGKVNVLHDALEGDHSAEKYDYGGPTQAAYVYQHENYNYWQDHLNVDYYGPGFFGENFTVENMPDSRICIGDIFRFGTAHFQVTKHRPPCKKLGYVAGDIGFIRKFMQAGRFGFYMRVLKQGEVMAGDEIELLQADPIGMTVEEYGMMLDVRKGDRLTLERALEIKDLEEAHRKRIETLLNKSS